MCIIILKINRAMALLYGDKMLFVSFAASFTVISAKAVSGMLQLTMAGSVQVNSAVFWVLLVIMVVTGIAQVK